MSSSALPTIDSRQVKAVDALCVERFGIPVDWLMEAAGWHVARSAPFASVVVCGVGNNAGDGLAAARHLQRWGRLARVCCVDIDRLRGPAASELQALTRGGVEVATELDLDGAEAVVDAIFGTGLSRAPGGRFADWIERINERNGYVVAVDLPSGLDGDTGQAYAPTVNASSTVTLGLPKPGLLVRDGPRHAGDVWIADIGVPLEAYREIGLDVPPSLFTSSDLVRM